MITQVKQGKIISVGKIVEDGLAKKLNPHVENPFLTKVKIKLDSGKEEVCLIGKIPKGYEKEEISIKTNLDYKEDRIIIAQEVYSQKYGLSIRIREYKRSEDLPFSCY